MVVSIEMIWVALTLKTAKVSGRIRFRSFSMTSQLHIVLPVIDDGRATDKCSLASGLRYRLCGRYRGLQSATFFIVCIFILSQ